MEGMIRAQVYQLDMGAMRKVGIWLMTKDEYEEINQSYGIRAIEVDKDDRHGRKLPNVLRMET